MRLSLNLSGQKVKLVKICKYIIKLLFDGGYRLMSEIISVDEMCSFLKFPPIKNKVCVLKETSNQQL